MRLAVSLHQRSWRLGLILAIAAGVGCERNGVQRGEPRAMEDGVYAVVKEGATYSEARAGDRGCAVLTYDGRYTGTGGSGPVRYVAVDMTSFVPLILDGDPDARNDDAGKTILSVTLQSEYVEKLEGLTRAQVGGKVAIVLDGEIVTLHKVRSAITEGKIQISRCTDNACEILRAKLTE